MNTELTASRYQTWNAPLMNRLLNLLARENTSGMAGRLIKSAGVSVAAFAIFLMLWSTLAAQVQTSLGVLPGPAKVWEQAVSLVDEHKAEREKEAAFMARQEKRNAEKLAKNPDAKVKIRPYTARQRSSIRF